MFITGRSDTEVRNSPRSLGGRGPMYICGKTQPGHRVHQIKHKAEVNGERAYHSDTENQIVSIRT